MDKHPFTMSAWENGCDFVGTDLLYAARSAHSAGAVAPKSTPTRRYARSPNSSRR